MEVFSSEMRTVNLRIPMSIRCDNCGEKVLGSLNPTVRKIHNETYILCGECASEWHNGPHPEPES